MVQSLRMKGESEIYIIMLFVLQRLFVEALNNFPNNTRIRVLYALFLRTKMD